MCLAVFAHGVHKQYPFILVANRDEFYSRPTASASYWQGAPSIFGGRDLKGGGGWLGVSRHGKLAAITNFRDPRAINSDAPSRGAIVKTFLEGAGSANDFFIDLNNAASCYNGFNLIAHSGSDLYYYTNKPNGFDPCRRLNAGVYGVSNHYLDTPWPKLERAKKALEQQVRTSDSTLDAEALFEFMTDQTMPPDDVLPRTGIELERERMLSTAFIETADYGTRSTSVVLMDRNGDFLFSERVYEGGLSSHQTTHHKIII